MDEPPAAQMVDEAAEMLREVGKQDPDQTARTWAKP